MPPTCRLSCHKLWRCACHHSSFTSSYLLCLFNLHLHAAAVQLDMPAAPWLVPRTWLANPLWTMALPAMRKWMHPNLYTTLCQPHLALAELI